MAGAEVSCLWVRTGGPAGVETDVHVLAQARVCSRVGTNHMAMIVLFARVVGLST